MAELTEEQLAEAERLFALFTPVPWRTYTHTPLWVAAECGPVLEDIAVCESADIARFVAEAHTGWPAAVAEVRRLRAENEALKARVSEAQFIATDCAYRADEALAEVKAAREQVATVTAERDELRAENEALKARVAELGVELDGYGAMLTRIAYPERGSRDEAMLLQDFANEIQAIWSLAQLEGGE